MKETGVNENLPGINDGTVLWGDYDNDGDLDLVLLGDSGNDGNGGYVQNQWIAEVY